MSKFKSINQELQFYCKQYWKLLGIKDLYSIYKYKVWLIEKSYQLPKEEIETQIDTFKCWIKYIEEWADRYILLLDLFNKIS